MSLRRRAIAVPTGNPTVDRAHRQVVDVVNSLLDADLADARVVVTDVLKSGAVNRVSHGLGRAPRAVFAVLHARGAGPVSDDRDANPPDNRFVYVYLSGATDSRATLILVP